ncbi:nuclear transport factor 2 family protein [Xanthomonas sp. AM6]|uniref:nuclear transport factor 2 family protein n=1 Tax=Xanthomonas sp. AM6 TaxID=2982531 RepID=UPI0021D7D7E5|nr:nuclear transport factor 2 family protein [Xanthomonas sp. AM6]UYB52972.1 nuclear transport factor 2 family protein [Xanthomonas sp. AM6]
MPVRHFALCALLGLSFGAAAADDEAAVRAADTRYWQAYNACDMGTMGELLTDDVEFYHDRTGLTATKAAVLHSLRDGPCADPAMHLRREAVAGSVQFHPLAGGFALLSGTHRFHVQRKGEPERLDGQAEFTNLWQSVDGQWRMRRIYSYAHAAAAYVPPATRLTLAPEVLARYAGDYRGQRVGDIRVVVEGDHLKLSAGTLAVTLRAEAPTRFFAEERDLRFVFAPAARAGTRKAGTRQLTVYENGTVVETATAP